MPVSRVEKTSARTVRDDVQNVLDYLLDAELCLYANPVAVSAGRHLPDGTPYETVRFVSYSSDTGFLTTHGQPDLEQYLAWVNAGAYSAVLFDGSLLQISYDVSAGGLVVGHRLAYMPCPYAVDEVLLREEALQDALGYYDGGSDMILRSQVRFDFEPSAAAPGHPQAHLTFNSPDCRIACVAPMHVLRFVDFVFRHTYPVQHRFHERFFKPAPWRHLGIPVLADDERVAPHLSWDVHATMTSVG